MCNVVLKTVEFNRVFYITPTFKYIYLNEIIFERQLGGCFCIQSVCTTEWRGQSLPLSHFPFLPSHSDHLYFVGLGQSIPEALWLEWHWIPRGPAVTSL